MNEMKQAFRGPDAEQNYARFLCVVLEAFSSSLRPS